MPLLLFEAQLLSNDDALDYVVTNESSCSMVYIYTRQGTQRHRNAGNTDKNRACLTTTFF